ncbi:putative RNA recognition motif domain, nucleotide-binding alpha-beta plait domain superfamily [Helianthus annuus]|nr:putative RNA recognition motif domain, nucleotide-binding alpha-beta plait domain superfamily [Helianthus annuus]
MAGVKSYQPFVNRIITKFYVSNLPVGCNPWDLADFVGVFGEVAGCYIARKKDKEGNRFGFISFVNVGDVKELERKLNGIKMGEYKLKVNITRFALENAVIWEQEGREKKMEVKKVGIHADNDKGNQSFSNSFVQEGKKFSDMFKPGSSKSADLQVRPTGQAAEVQAPEKTVTVHEETVMGRTIDFNSLTGLKEILKDVDCKIFYVGGFNVLLVFKEDHEASEFLVNQEGWMKWFSHLDMWKGQAGAYERLAWLKIVGAPIHLAEK